MADWVTISALATAGGTLVLAGTTYASLLAGLRLLLMRSAPDDPTHQAGFIQVDRPNPR